MLSLSLSLFSYCIEISIKAIARVPRSRVSRQTFPKARLQRESRRTTLHSGKTAARQKLVRPPNLSSLFLSLSTHPHSLSIDNFAGTSREAAGGGQVRKARLLQIAPSAEVSFASYNGACARIAPILTIYAPFSRFPCISLLVSRALFAPEYENAPAVSPLFRRVFSGTDRVRINTPRRDLKAERHHFAVGGETPPRGHFYIICEAILYERPNLIPFTYYSILYSYPRKMADDTFSS